MAKYLEVAKIHMKAQLAWRADVVFNMLFTIAKILFAYLLWGTIFQGKSVIGQFTFHGMLSYYIISSFLSQLEMSGGVSSEIHDHIRQGSFSKFMVIPVNIEAYFVFMEIGVVGFYFFFDLIAVVMWKYIFRIQFQFTHDLGILACAAAMILLGLFFMVQLNYLLGIMTLKYQGIGTFLMIKNNLMELVTGTIVPLALFPDAIVEVMKYLPFYYVTYLPSMLLIGQCSQEAVKGLAIIMVWCIVIQAVIRVTWKKYIRKYDGAGI